MGHLARSKLNNLLTVHILVETLLNAAPATLRARCLAGLPHIQNSVDALPVTKIFTGTGFRKCTKGYQGPAQNAPGALSQPHKGQCEAPAAIAYRDFSIHILRLPEAVVQKPIPHSCIAFGIAGHSCGHLQRASAVPRMSNEVCDGSTVHRITA